LKILRKNDRTAFGGIERWHLGARRKSIKHYDYHYVAISLPKRKEKKMDKKPDSFAASLIWGRIGAAVLCLAAVALSALGVDFSADEQSNVNELVGGILAGIAGLLAIVSKLRESKK
jgi:hypothetical protein